MRLTVATFNIHNDVDRYGERRELLAAAFAHLGADVVALQEVRLTGERQDDLLMSAAPAHAYRGFDVRYPKYPDYGLVILAAASMEVLVHERLALGSD
ncbi:MAG: endonuclease/exonuclease/phosphatase family protein, partial [Hyphomicrobiales bacterium]